MEAFGDMLRLMVCGGAMLAVIGIGVTIAVVLLVTGKKDRGAPSDREERQ